MKYKILQEITQWDVATPNHTYYVDTKTEKCVAFIRNGSNTVNWLEKPLRFDKRYRRFKKLGFGSTAS